MASRFVRFASFDADGAARGNGKDNAAAADYSHHLPSASAIEAAARESRRASIASTSSNSNHSGRRLSEGVTTTNINNNNGGAQSVAPSIASHAARKVNTAIAANDGPSLAAALAQSIRHHARLIDGEQRPLNRKEEELRAKDPYEDDDHVSLAPGVELNYDRDAQPSSSVWEVRGKAAHNHKQAVDPALRAYVANAAAEATDGDRGGVAADDVETLRQQERIDERLREVSFSTRFKKNISNWFGLDASQKSDGDGDVDIDGRARRSVRFAGDDDYAAIAAAIAGGEAVPGAGPGALAGGHLGRAPKFVAPSPSAFRTATRHPSHLDPGQFGDYQSRLDAPRRILAARKRHRRNDSFLRLAVAILCFGLSLAFAVVYGQGQLGLALTTVAYERKIAGLYDNSGYHDDDVVPRDVFYPDWWEDEKGIPDMESRGVRFSPTLEYNAADVAMPRAPGRIETPFFWFVPRSGGNVIRTLMANCLRLAEASEHGAGSEAAFLRIEEQDDRKFVNVDMSTSMGIEHAKDLDLASSGVPDVIISGDIHGVLSIFNNRNRARVFAILRHPLDRAISKYYADLSSDPDVAGMTLPQYVRSGGHRVENNYLTRYLSGRYGGKLTVHHLDVAREFLRRKFVVGLASDLPATANLFGHVFGWNHTTASLGLSNVDLCYDDILGALSGKKPPSIEEGTEGWKLLVAQNWFDLKIYEYAEHLFQLQVDQLKLTRSGKMENAETVI